MKRNYNNSKNYYENPDDNVYENPDDNVYENPDDNDYENPDDNVFENPNDVYQHSDENYEIQEIPNDRDENNITNLRNYRK